MVDITDEMVERARCALKYYSESQAAQTNDVEIRAMLHAALNPPPEPPLPAAQIEAGWQEFVNSSYRDSVEGKRIVARIYRVMKSMEPRTPRERVMRAVMTPATDERGAVKDRRAEAGHWLLTGGKAPWEARGDVGRAVGVQRRADDR